MSSHHFGGKDAAGHIKEKRLEASAHVSEGHGVEIPGHLHAASDALKEVALLLGLLWIVLFFQNLEHRLALYYLAVFAFGLILWKTGRSAWLGWFRLERFHRITEQEKYEIEHHRSQEREELEELYREKGFEGKLLDDVVDVLMADQDRLLKVMLEEELGLKLEIYEHPLKQALGAFLGALCASLILLGLFWLHPLYGVFVGALVLIALSSAMAAYFEKNKVLNATLWNCAIATLALGAVYFLVQL